MPKASIKMTVTENQRAYPTRRKEYRTSFINEPMKSCSLVQVSLPFWSACADPLMFARELSGNSARSKPAMTEHLSAFPVPCSATDCRIDYFTQGV